MHPRNPPQSSMPVRAALQVLAEYRDEATIVVTNQGSARVWPLIAENPLDFHYNPSTMGGAISLGLGLAIARPLMQVIVLSGDGALTMNLGCLISVAAADAQNLTVVVLDNGRYEVTGGQRTAASEARVDYPQLAKAAGFTTVFGYHEEAIWRQQAERVLNSRGPRFISLQVDAALPNDLATSLPPIKERLEKFVKQLADYA